jgi:CubicO group peptidase (beta-lactamase class C family)
MAETSTPSEFLLESSIDRFFESQNQPRPSATVVALVSAGSVDVCVVDGTLTSGQTLDGATQFRIASMTKSFTAAAVLQLRDRGKLALDTPVADLVKGAAAIVGPTDDSPVVTVRHLLTMSAGFASDDPWGDRQLDLRADDFDAMVRSGTFFANPPGFGFQYSNLGYALLGSVIESVSGVSAREFISTQILTPLAMLQTTWDEPHGSNVAIGEHRRPGLDVGPALGYGAFSPMGGLWSTVTDLARWVEFFCDAFPARDGGDSSVLSRASRREMQRTHTSWNPRIVDTAYGPRLTEVGYGMGLVEVRHPDLGTVIHHSGGLPGFGSNMRWVPDLGFGIVALANRTYAPMRPLTAELLEDLHAARLLPAATSKRRWPTETVELDRQAAALVNWIWRLAGTPDREPDWAMNVDLDLPLTARRADADDLVTRVGAMISATVVPSTRASGKIHVTTPTTMVTIEFSLSPEAQPRLQWYEVSGE